MALWLCFTSLWGWPCSACGVVSPPEEGYTFFPAPSLPPRLHLLLCKLTFSYPCLTPCHGSVHTALPEAYSDIFPKVQGRSTEPFEIGPPFGHTGGCCHQGSHLFADSVTALPLKWNVFCINSNIVTLRSRALLRGGFNPIIRGRYTWKYVNSGWSWVTYSSHVVSFPCKSEMEKRFKIFFFLLTLQTPKLRILIMSILK